MVDDARESAPSHPTDRNAEMAAGAVPAERLTLDEKPAMMHQAVPAIDRLATVATAVRGAGPAWSV